MSKKIKVLAYCDAPTCATGFGTVSRNIFEALHRTGKYDIDILGINYFGDPHGFPYRIWPVNTNQERDPFGRQKVLNMMSVMDFDLLFFLQDTFILKFLPTLISHLKLNRKQPFKSVGYFPVDSILKPEWVANIDVLDYLVAYTDFGKKEFLKHVPERQNLSVITHGVNIKEFFPIKNKDRLNEFKNNYFGDHANAFIITNVNRNQQRKDIPRTLMAFKEFKKQVPKSVLYLHMAINDMGWNLSEVCENMGLSISKDVIFPQNFSVNQGYPREILNALYNCSDVVVSTTTGEGFALSWLESMAAKTPVIMPNNTAMTEFITEDKGYLVNSGNNKNLWTTMPHDNGVQRPLVDIDDMVEKLLHVYNNPTEVKEKVENAYKWVTTEMDWQGPIAKQWVGIFDEAYESSQKNDFVDYREDDKNIIKSEEL